MVFGHIFVALCCMVFVAHNSISYKNSYGHGGDQGPSNYYNIQGAQCKQVPNIMVVTHVIVGHDKMVFDHGIVVLAFGVSQPPTFVPKSGT